MVTQQNSDDELVARETIPSSDVTRIRFGEIDGLRALAILAAVVYEATRLAAPSTVWHPALARLFSDASQGLPLFFLLSGFLLAYPALATLREDGRTYLDVGRYIIKRLLRVYPAYLLVLGLAFVVPPLALQYGLPALANGSTGLTGPMFAQNLFFLGDGLGNDGFRALALEARWYVLFPFALLLWARAPRIFFGVMVVAAGTDLFLSGAHAWGIGALVPFMLGIVAADVRAGHHRFERYAFLTAALAAVAAVLLERFLLALPGPAGAPGALRIDPLWSIATFGLLVGTGTSTVVERVLGVRIFRFAGAASYGTALVVVPMASFIVRQVVLSFGPGVTALNAAIFAFLGGIVIWQLADRWFADGTLRRDVAELIGPWLNHVLRLIRLDRITLGAPLPIEVPEIEQEAVNAEFYAPPPRSDGELASVSTRTGSPEDLAAEIMETKKRLSDRSSAIFAEGEPVEPEPDPELVEAEPALKPGFYRRPAALKPPAEVPAPPPAAAAPPARPVLKATPAPAPAAAPAPAPAPASVPVPVPASMVAAPGPRVAPAPAPRVAAPAAPAAAAPPAPPAPPRAAQPRPEPPAYREAAPISLSFEAPPYEHYSLEPAAPAPAAPTAPQQPVPVAVAQPRRPAPPLQPPPLLRAVPPLPTPAPAATPTAPTTRGPIKMRIGALGPAPTNGNGTRHTMDKA